MQLTSSGGPLDRIIVRHHNGGGFPSLDVRVLVAWNGDTSGGTGPGEPGSMNGRPALSDDPAPCDTGTSQVDDNQQALMDLWEDSDYAWTRFRRERSNYSALEQGGFIFPDGSFLDLRDIPGAITEQSACTLGINRAALPELPDGTIFVHTHPWYPGDDQNAACSGGPHAPYASGPGEGDAPALQDLGVERGIILDGRGLVEYDQDEQTINHDRCHY